MTHSASQYASVQREGEQAAKTRGRKLALTAQLRLSLRSVGLSSGVRIVWLASVQG